MSRSRWMTPKTDTVVQATSYAGAGTSIIAGLTLTDVGILVGIATAVLTLLLNFVYILRKDRREEREHRLEVERLSGKSERGSTRLKGLIGAGVLGIAALVVAPFEGRSLVAYVDPVGIPTICEGVTRGVQLGDTATDAECDEMLERELQTHLAGLERCIGGYLTPNQWAAALSWTYNVGVGAACNSTLVRLINQGEPPNVWCPELKRWVYAGGRKLAGLERRREAEYQLCIGDS